MREHGELVELIFGSITVQCTLVFPVTSSTDAHVLEVITDQVGSEEGVFHSVYFPGGLLIVKKKIKFAW